LVDSFILAKFTFFDRWSGFLDQLDGLMRGLPDWFILIKFALTQGLDYLNSIGLDFRLQNGADRVNGVDGHFLGRPVGVLGVGDQLRHEVAHLRRKVSFYVENQRYYALQHRRVGLEVLQLYHVQDLLTQV